MPSFSEAIDSERNWVSLGESRLGHWNIYIDKDSVKRIDEGIYAAITYEDLGVTQKGLDMSDSGGSSRYITDITYRSYRSINLYDCKKKLVGNIETRYYVGPKPSKEGLVYKNVAKNPIWLPIIEKKFFDYVCRNSGSN